MNIEKLKTHIQHFLDEEKENPAKHRQDFEERLERIAYYQSWTKEKILQMSEEDLFEYMSKLWAMLIWGNKQYYVDKLISNNGLENFRTELAELIWGIGKVNERWDKFRERVKGLGPAMISEILCHVYPDDCMIWNRRAHVGLRYLDVENLPRYDYQVTGSNYIRLCNEYKLINNYLKEAGIKDSNLLTVDYFVWDELQVVDNLSEMHNVQNVNIPISSAATLEVVSETESKFIHDDVRDAIRDIGNFLGFDASIERKIAEGSRIDTIWESKVGNMGRIIYVFEVQTKGSLDSLLINLQQSLNSEAVQGIVAVSDKEQLEKIKRKAATIPSLKDRLKYWDYEEILKVKESLQFVYESINNLKLVPEGL